MLTAASRSGQRKDGEDGLRVLRQEPEGGRQLPAGDEACYGVE